MPGLARAAKDAQAAALVAGGLSRQVASADAWHLLAGQQIEDAAAAKGAAQLDDAWMFGYHLADDCRVLGTPVRMHQAEYLLGRFGRTEGHQAPFLRDVERIDPYRSVRCPGGSLLRTALNLTHRG